MREDVSLGVKTFRIDKNGTIFPQNESHTHLHGVDFRHKAVWRKHHRRVEKLKIQCSAEISITPFTEALKMISHG